MKHLLVACAIIERDGAVLVTQRGAAMSLPLKWEFPGGKIEPSEQPKDCLRREIAEELGLNISVKHVLPLHTHCYNTITVTLCPFICTIESGELTLLEHAAFSWLTPEKLHDLDWAEADLPVVQNYLDRLKAILP